MKRILSFFALGLSAAMILGGCARENLAEGVIAGEAVTFKAADGLTKTAIDDIDGGKVSYSWANTAVSSIHVFENGIEGATTAISIDETTGQAAFTVTFGERTGSYTYKALIASDVDGAMPAVPSVQSPAANSFDPAADILIGQTTDEVSTRPDVMEMYFYRAVVMGRFIIQNIPAGEKIKSVKFIAPEGTKLAGRATAVDYTDATCTYGAAENDSNVIELAFTENNTVSGDFEAYFACCPPAAALQSFTVVVTTDKYIRTKAVDASAHPLALALGKFAKVSLNMEGVPAEAIKTFTKVDAFTSGKNYVIVSGGNALKNNNGTDEIFSVSGNISGNTLTLSAEDAESLMWTAERNTDFTTQGDYTLKNGGYYLIRQGTGNNAVLSNGAISTYFVWTLDGSNLRQKNSSGQYTFYLYIASNQWSANTQTAQNNISIYEESDGKLDRNLAFTDAEVEKSFGDEAFTNVLTGTDADALVGVTYSSDDEAVASVDATTGLVTVGTKAGTAHITATAPASETYRAGSASFTIVVINPNPTTYYKITRPLADWSGTYLFVKESANVAFAYNQSNYKVAVTISEGTIVSSDLADYEMTVSTSSLGAGKYDIQVSDNRYLYKYGNTDILFSSNISNNNQYFGEFSLSGDGDVTLDSHRPDGSDNYFQYSGTAFGYGTSSSATFQIYRLDDGSTPEYDLLPRNLAFAQDDVQKNITDTDFTIALTGDKTDDVVYSSDNDAVATVNASTGEVHIVGTGEATITASAAATAEYRAGEASFTLTVIDPSLVTTLYRVTEIESGEQYAVYANGHLLMKDGTSLGAEAVELDSNNNIEVISTAGLLWTTSPNNVDSGYPGYNLTCDGYSLRRTSGGGNVTLSNGALDKYFAWNYANGNSLKNGSYALNYSGSSWTSQYNGTSTVYLYSLTAPKQNRNLAFAEASVVKLVGDDAFTNALSGEKTDDVTYISSDETVATVSAAGLVTVVGAGSATITASAIETDEYKAGSASFELTVNKLERNLSFASPNVQKLTTDDPFTNALSGEKTDDVTYGSSKESVATVSAAGLVTIVGVGNATITASAEATSVYKAGEASFTLVVTDPNAKSYVLVTSEPVNWSGKYLIVSSSADGSAKAMSFSSTASGDSQVSTTTADVTVSGGKIVSSTEIDRWAITITSAGEVHPNQTSGESLCAYDAVFSDGNSLYWYSSQWKQGKPDRGNRNNRITLKCFTDGVRLMSAGYPTTSTPSKNYMTFASGNFGSGSATGNRVQLYLLEGSGTDVPPMLSARNLAFAQSSVQKNIGDANFTETVTGDKTDDVVYSSDNDAVATVNASTGEVTIVAVGTAHITASAEANAGYKAESVSYTLKVIDPSAVPVSYYTKMNSLPTTTWEKVLFVYDNGDGTGYAFKGIYDGDASSSPSGSTDSNSAFLTPEGNAVPVTITSEGIASSAEVDACTLTLEYTTDATKYSVLMDNNGGYFRMLSSGTNAGRFVCMNSGGYRLTYSVSGTGANNFSGKRESYYFGFDGTNFAGSESSSYKFSIYKLSE